MKNVDCYNIIEAAREETIKWAREAGQYLYRIDYVAVFEDWSKGIGVYIFFKDEKEREAAQGNGFTKELESYHIGMLRKKGYPFDKYPEVIYYFDSDENIKKNYDGSYFYRLR